MLHDVVIDRNQTFAIKTSNADFMPLKIWLLELNVLFANRLAFVSLIA